MKLQAIPIHGGTLNRVKLIQGVKIHLGKSSKKHKEMRSFIYLSLAYKRNNMQNNPIPWFDQPYRGEATKTPITEFTVIPVTIGKNQPGIQPRSLSLLPVKSACAITSDGEVCTAPFSLQYHHRRWVSCRKYCPIHTSHSRSHFFVSLLNCGCLIQTYFALMMSKWLILRQNNARKLARHGRGGTKKEKNVIPVTSFLLRVWARGGVTGMTYS